MRRPGDTHPVTAGLQSHHPLPKGYLPLLDGRGEGLGQLEKGVGWVRVLDNGQEDPRMGNRHSSGYPRPIL